MRGRTASNPDVDPNQPSELWCAVLGYRLDPPPEGFDSSDAFLGRIGVPAE